MKESLSNLPVLVVSTNERLTLRLLRGLDKLSIKADILALNKSSGSTKISKFCRKYTRYSQETVAIEWEAIAETINQYCEKENIAVIIPSGMQATFILSAIKTKITAAKVFPLAHPETIQRIHNKWFLYEDISPQGLSFPKSVLLENLEQLNSLEIEFPIIVKPIELAGGKGIKKINSLLEVQQYLATSHADNQLPLILQEYIDGYDICLSVLAKQGEVIAWTIQEGLPHYLKFFQDDAVLDLGKRIISFYNFTGIANFDLRVDRNNNQAKIIECNPRIWASVEASLWYGVNFLQLGILLALEQTIPPELQTEVLSSQPTKVPYPWLGRTIKGYINGRFPIKEIPKLSLGIFWQNLFDISPSIYDKILTQLGRGEVHDNISELLTARMARK